MDTLVCRRCGEDKPLDAFATDRRHTLRQGRQSYCRECMAEYNTLRHASMTEEQREALNAKRRASVTPRKTTPESQRNSTLKSRYGITLEEYNRRVEEQGGVCALCGEEYIEAEPGKVPRGLHVDHDHSCCPGRRSCGECIRGLLCAKCNHLLGNARDSTDVLLKAIEYLESASRRG